MSELWSPAMRRWARDSELHGIVIGFIKHRPARREVLGWSGGGTGGIGPRITDGNAYRDLDDSTGPHEDIRYIDNS